MPQAGPHRLTAVDPDGLTATCSVCGVVDVYRRTHDLGFMCGPAQRARMERVRIARRAGRVIVGRTPLAPGESHVTTQSNGRPYHRYKGPTCTRCGLSPLSEQVLCVHHVDLNHENNDPANLRTLCHNCHHELHALLRVQESAAEEAA